MFSSVRPSARPENCRENAGRFVKAVLWSDTAEVIPILKKRISS